TLQSQFKNLSVEVVLALGCAVEIAGVIHHIDGDGVTAAADEGVDGGLGPTASGNSWWRHLVDHTVPKSVEATKLSGDTVKTAVWTEGQIAHRNRAVAAVRKVVEDFRTPVLLSCERRRQFKHAPPRACPAGDSRTEQGPLRIQQEASVGM